MPTPNYFRLGFKYDSQTGSQDGSRAFTTPAGRGWSHNYNVTAAVNADGHLAVGRGSRCDLYFFVDGRYVGGPGFFNEAFAVDGGFEIHWPNQTVERFNGAGKLAEIRNRTGQKLVFEYNAAGQISRTIDSLGRFIDWNYDAAGFLANVTDFAGRSVTLGHDADGNLTSITGPAVVGTSTGNDFPLGKTIGFQYFGGSDPRLKNNLVAVIAPNEFPSGPAKIRVAYETSASSPDFDRVRSLTVGGTNASGVAAGGTISYAYQDLGVAAPDVNTPVFSTTVTDRNTNVTVYNVNRLGNIVEKRELTRGLRPGAPAAFPTRYLYNPDGLMLMMQPPEGNVHSFIFDSTNPDRAAQGNLIEYIRLPGPRGGDQAALTQKFAYEPIYQQMAAYIEERGNAPGFSPQNGGAASAARYTTRMIFDYQEGTNVAALAAVRGLPESFVSGLLSAAGIAMGLGDVNGDGATIDVAGNPVQKIMPPVVLPDGSAQAITEEYLRNFFGQFAARIDGEGNLDTYLYYAAGDPNGDGLRVDLDAGARATGLGYLARVTRDAGTTPKRTETAPPAVILNDFLYDEVGNVVGDIDGRRNLRQQEVNALNQVVRTISEAPFFYEVRHFFDANNNPVGRAIENKDGDNNPGTPAFFVHRYVFDILDHEVTADLDAAGSTPSRLVTGTRYDANENPSLTILPEGNRIARVYDERDLLFTQTPGAGSPDAATHTFNYSGNRNRVEMIDAEDTDGVGGPERWVTRFDGYDRPIEQLDPLNGRAVTTYDPASNPIRVQNFGHVAGGSAIVLLAETVQKFDELSRGYEVGRRLFANSGGAPTGPVVLTDGPTGDTGFVSTVTFFDRDGRAVAAIDDEGDPSFTEYDGVDRAVRRIDALGNEIVATFDGNSNPVSIKEIEKQPEGLLADQSFETILVYDTLDRQTEVQDPLKHTRRTKYDSRGNDVFTSDAKDGSSADGVVNGHGNTVLTLYDGASRPLAVHRHLRAGGVGAGGLDTSNPFNPDGVVSTFQSWDGNSRLRSHTDDNLNTTTYGYNARDILGRETFADGTFRTFTLDLDDNIRVIRDQNGSVLTCRFDALNRKVRCDIARGPGVGGTTLQTWIYDGLSRLRGSTDNNDPADPTDDSVVRIDVDSLDRTIEERQNGRVIPSSWFGENRRVGLSYPGGRQVTLGHDGLDRIKSIVGDTVLAAYNYAGPSRVIFRSLGNGTRLSIGYDGDRRPVTWTDTNSRNQLLVGFSYEWDREHNRTSEFRHHEGDGDGYAYDSIYRVTAAGFDNNRSAAFYTLDGVHNWRRFGRTQDNRVLFDVENTVNEMNEYVTFGNTTETHDDNGNLTRREIFKENGQIDKVQRLFWDAHNRLAFVTEKLEGNSPERVVAKYAYHADNRRLLKRVFVPAARSQVVEETLFYYDGWRTIEEQDPRGVTMATYVSGPMYIDEHVAMDRRDGNGRTFSRLYYHANSLFSVHALTNNAGQVVETVRYDLYGKPFINRQDLEFGMHPVEIEPAILESPHRNAFLFTGHRFDPNVQLYWTRLRTFNFATGRFTQRDPIAGAFASPWYPYAENNPTNLQDTYGLQAQRCDPACSTSPTDSNGNQRSSKNCVYICIDSKGAYGFGHASFGVSSDLKDQVGYYPDGWRNDYRRMKRASDQTKKDPSAACYDCCCFSDQELAAVKANVDKARSAIGSKSHGPARKDWAKFGYNCATVIVELIGSRGAPNIPTNIPGIDRPGTLEDEIRENRHCKRRGYRQAFPYWTSP
jgi:RHS repeat-associated protein